MKYYKQKQGRSLWLHILFAVAKLFLLLLLFWVGSGTGRGVTWGDGLLLLNLFCRCTNSSESLYKAGLLFPHAMRRIPWNRS